MIVYFADRQMNVLGQASTELPGGLTVVDDLKTEDVETGVAVFECTVPFTKKTRSMVEACTEVGNYILRSHDNENEFYQIIDAEIDTKKKEVYIYAEDDGMDLLNEIVGADKAEEAQPISHYINKYAAGAGFQIGINEVENLTRKLSWEGEATAAERIASVATQFDGCEVSYSFDIDGLVVAKKYINIFKKRGKDVGLQLRLNKEVDRIITKKTISNLATAFQCTGGTPEDENIEDDVEPTAITLEGYSYDDGDFYVDGKYLKSRKALERWRRLLWKTDESQSMGGHIVKQYSYDTLNQATLCSHAITELKKICDMEVNYEVDITKLDAKVGDRINIVDDDGELYLSTRILKLETSVTNDEKKATLGEHLLKGSGISQKVADLAAQFAKLAVSAERALAIANSAKAMADAAQEKADSALQDAENAQQKADDAADAANNAQQSADNAQQKADEAKDAVEDVKNDVADIDKTVSDAQQAADNAQQAADAAQQKADEAAQAAAQAKADAADAKAQVEIAQTNAETAITKSETAKETAEAAKAEADTAKATADAAKIDAQKANEDIANLGNQLETVTTTMQADYARKTDLTEATASLQTQISQNAAEITSTASRVQTIDETANNAQEQAQSAKSVADQAKAEADQAKADAQAAQNAADTAATAAANAQNEADTARAAAETAKSVADQAEADLEAAKEDLATVSSRVDATEEEIIAAQEAVTAAQEAADKAKADAQTATTKAAEAQAQADTAVQNASDAQAAANEAAQAAAIAQQTANEAKGDAAAAQAKADEAAQTAAAAQATADTAKTNATNAQAKADQAAADAAAAQSKADDADAKAAQAKADLEAAQQNLADVTSRVDATEEEVAAAQAAVTTAKNAADRAQAEAEAAQATANTAKADAATAQEAADNAKTAADNAQQAADEAQQAADEAQAAVDALAVRVTTAETKITQNSEQISLMAKKTEVAEMLNGYSTKEETEAAITLASDSITSSVSSTFATKQEVKDIAVGGRNLLLNSKGPFEATETAGNYGSGTLWNVGQDTYSHGIVLEPNAQYTLSFDYVIVWGECTPITPTVSIGIGATPGAFEADFTGNTVAYYGHGKYHTTTEDGYPLSGRLVFVFTTPNEQTLESKPYFAMRPARTSTATALQNSTFTFSNFKLEKGNKVTDWTPAPEDIEGAVEETNVALESTNEKVLASESLIQQLSDAISMLVVDEDGTTLLEQTGEGFTFNLASTEKAVTDIQSSLATLQEETGSTQATVDALQQAISDTEAKLDYVNIGSYEDEPCIELGESENEFKLMITNTRIMFRVGSDVPTHINSRGIVTENIEVKGEIIQGGYVQVITSDGGWGVLWKGVSS